MFENIKCTILLKIVSDKILKFNHFHASGLYADPESVALDPTRRLVYWTDEERNALSMAGMDDNLESRVFIDGELDQPRAIAVNLRNG